MTIIPLGRIGEVLPRNGVGQGTCGSCRPWLGEVVARGGLGEVLPRNGIGRYDFRAGLGRLRGLGRLGAVSPIPTVYDASRGFAPSSGMLPSPTGTVVGRNSINTLVQAIDYARNGQREALGNSEADVTRRDAWREAANRYRWVNDLALWANSVGVTANELAGLILNLREAIRIADGAADVARTGGATVTSPSTGSPVGQRTSTPSRQTSSANQPDVVQIATQPVEPLRAGLPWGKIAAGVAVVLGVGILFWPRAES